MTLLILVLVVFLNTVEAKCVMTQTCLNPENEPDYDACIPEAYKIPVDSLPMTGNGWPSVIGGGNCTTNIECNSKGHCINGMCVCRHDGMAAGPHCNQIAIQCPAYKNDACCSWQQNYAMAENFKLLASVFAKNNAGGCDACAANLMSLWCGLICSPFQDKFMHMTYEWPSITYRPDPMTGKEKVKVLEVNVALTKNYTCGIFDSCKNTAMASMAAGMKSSLGFLNYQMQVGAVGHGEFITLVFNQSTQQSFHHDILECSNYSEIIETREILPIQAQLLETIASKSKNDKQCPCGACRATCDTHKSNGTSIHVVENPISVFTGFNTKLVAIVYGLLVIFVFLWNKWNA
ncbi:Cholesterol transport protein (Niemann-Pick C disease protein) [Plasmopara halstedii]|uniref:Cholesterol transport protein (Niemann-Pick C disease protein) n=1 Tax=Plasmopara halstedii TaxID=4781 RepID=A0A0P1B7G6_PLAHL|nr:Cholesterol transport protein (Niemann-Pick C disease protein) [Plasmopara halstedii]CEG50432.1 Cholesterol transport protein (Niemann-Pick C disease protein) [Plasmopara halstedii]|eukprot:XP_024586801.1 Cholesterol transport protein (Niemann-Pick C disease protein) [Plasmopara halstedii]